MSDGGYSRLYIPSLGALYERPLFVHLDQELSTPLALERWDKMRQVKKGVPG